LLISSRPEKQPFSWMLTSKTASHPEKRPFSWTKPRHINSPIRKTWIFADGTLKFARLIRNLAEFTDRTTFAHTMRNLFPMRPNGSSLHETFDRQVYNMNSENSELALVKLMELFNHSSVAITKRYLGLRQEEILETYDCLTF